jgi:hypothetical protein
MTTPQHQLPLAPGNPPPSMPERVARTVGLVVKTLIVVVGWGVLAIATLAAAYVALRAVLWMVSLALRALGAGS